MDFHQIRYFILTAQLQNMSKAAQALNIAQPSLSKSISNLEKELGTQLFDRSGKKLILNERGKAFLAGAKSAMDELDGAAAAARSSLADFTLHIGMFCMSAQLIECISTFLNENPMISFDICHLSGNLDRIDTNAYDLLLYPADSIFRRYRGALAYTEDIFLAVHQTSKLASAEKVSLSELGDERLIFIKYGEKEYESAYWLYQNSVAKRNPVNFCCSCELQRLMISSNCGAGFVPEGSANAYYADKNIRLIPIADDGFSRSVFIGFKRDKHLSEHGRQLAAYVKEYFRMDDES